MAIDGRDEIKIQTMIRNAMQAAKDDSASEGAGVEGFSAYLKELDEKFDEFLNGLKEHVLNDKIRVVLNKFMEEVKTDLSVTKEFLKELHLKTSPVRMQNTMNELHTRIVNVECKMKQLASDFNEQMNTRFIEEVSNQEIKQLYLQSGLGLKHIQDEFKIAHSTAHQYVHGEVKDMMTRHKMKQFLISKIKENISL
jgi:hypothetical protein